MNYQIVSNALGGMALFLLAMLMMTEGLKVFAGGSLKRLLEQWTSTPLRGVFAGMLVTGIVQSSSAVTVAAIGFVNAGVLTTRQALGVIYGTNVGTTMTGWLVSLVGFGFKIEAFALPILALGAALRLGARGKRHQGLGEALAGFGLFFLGLALLKEAFSGVAGAYGASLGDGAGAGNWPAAVLAGFLATVLTQSSSAAIAIILTAAAGGVLGIEPAAAAVIGANLGTTSTAALAVLRATPAAKRLALGHVAFNLITGIVALLLLPVLLHGVALLADTLDVEGSPAAVLALFHTVFNVLGVLLLLPLTSRLARWLEGLFRAEEEVLAHPQHLDATLAATPDLALAALQEELRRVRTIVVGLAREATGSQAGVVQHLASRAQAVRALGAAIGEFVGSVRTEVMPRTIADDLARGLRTARYLDEAASRIGSATGLWNSARRSGDARVAVALQQALVLAGECVELAGRTDAEADRDIDRAVALDRFEQAYQAAKTSVLDAAVLRAMSVSEASATLDALSDTKRMVEQLVKADRLLRAPGRAQAIEAEVIERPALDVVESQARGAQARTT